MLLSSTQKLQIVLVGAVTTAELPLVAGWADMLDDASTLAPASATSITTGATAVDLVPAPAAGSKRQIKYLSAYNADTSTATVIAQIVDGANTRVVASVALAAGSRLEYTGEGFRVFDASGALVGIGAPGTDGSNGTDGAAATIAVGTVTTGAAGSSATVSNSGTSSAAVFDFTIPEGDQGDPGAAATVAVGTVTTGAPGTSASVSNSGTSSAAVLDFTIPAGAVGLATVITYASTTYTVLAADASAYRRMTATTAKTVTVGPESGEALPANYEQHFDNDGAGTITFVAGSGVTIKPAADGSLIVPQNGVVTLKRLAADVFRLVGITEAP